MNRLTTYNPIETIERAFDGFLNLTPVFHSLEEVYRTGDTVRFASKEEGLIVQIDLPGVKKEHLDISVDNDTRDVYITAKRTITMHNSEETLNINRSFSVGREFDLNKIKFDYTDGMLSVNIPRRKKEEYVKKYTV
jgi:HSP20 family protein